MSRFDTAYLVVEDPSDTATFEMSIGLQGNSQMEKRFLLGPRGQYVTEVFNAFSIFPDIDGPAQRRAAFTIDGGAGEWQKDISFEVGPEDVQWGDGSGGTGQSNVTARDASGPDVNPFSRRDIMELWLTQARTDSDNVAFFYHAEWTDGTPAEHSEAGAFNQPFVCSVKRYSLDDPDPNNDPPSELTGTITLEAVTPFYEVGIPPALDDSNINDYAQEAADNLDDFYEEN